MVTSSFAPAAHIGANDRLGDRPRTGPDHSFAAYDSAAPLGRQRIQGDGRRRRARPGAHRQRGINAVCGGLRRRRRQLLKQKASGEDACYGVERTHPTAGNAAYQHLTGGVLGWSMAATGHFCSVAGWKPARTAAICAVNPALWLFFRAATVLAHSTTPTTGRRTRCSDCSR